MNWRLLSLSFLLSTPSPASEATLKQKFAVLKNEHANEKEIISILGNIQSDYQYDSTIRNALNSDKYSVWQDFLVKAKKVIFETENKALVIICASFFRNISESNPAILEKKVSKEFLEAISDEIVTGNALENLSLFILKSERLYLKTTRLYLKYLLETESTSLFPLQVIELFCKDEKTASEFYASKYIKAFISRLNSLIKISKLTEEIQKINDGNFFETQMNTDIKIQHLCNILKELADKNRETKKYILENLSTNPKALTYFPEYFYEIEKIIEEGKNKEIYLQMLLQSNIIESILKGAEIATNSHAWYIIQSVKSKPSVQLASSDWERQKAILNELANNLDHSEKLLFIENIMVTISKSHLGEAWIRQYFDDLNLVLLDCLQN